MLCCNPVEKAQSGSLLHCLACSGAWLGGPLAVAGDQRPGNVGAFRGVIPPSKAARSTSHSHPPSKASRLWAGTAQTISGDPTDTLRAVWNRELPSAKEF